MKHVDSRLTSTTKQLQKSKPIDSPLMPESIVTWRDALSNVNFECLSPNPRARDAAYFFPSPTFFLSGRAHKYISSWIAIREAWIFRAFCGEAASALLSQEWRELLFGTVSQQSTGKFQQQAYALLGPNFTAVVQEAINSQPQSISLTEDDHRTILWELAELNFRFELLSLDRRASGSSSPDRQSLVQQCFPGGVHGVASLLAVSAEEGMSGWAALDIRSRKPYIMALERLIRGWRSSPLSSMANSQTREHTDTYFAELESLLINTYVHQFYSFFGRAPVLPMRLRCFE
jgi:hypothetical protein